jgi:Putative RNA-binding domain in YlmH
VHSPGTHADRVHPPAQDFLGACLHTGIERSKVGDIIILSELRGAQILLVPELVPFLEVALVKVGPRMHPARCKWCVACFLSPWSAHAGM